MTLGLPYFQFLFGTKHINYLIFLSHRTNFNSNEQKENHRMKEECLLPLHSIGQCLSFYADDVALFILPKETDLQITRNLLLGFGDVSGLQTNFQKSYHSYPL